MPHEPTLPPWCDRGARDAVALFNDDSKKISVFLLSLGAGAAGVWVPGWWGP